MASPNPTGRPNDRHIALLQQFSQREGGTDAIRLALEVLSAANAEIAARTKYESVRVHKKDQAPSYPPERMAPIIEQSKHPVTRVGNTIARGLVWVFGVASAAFTLASGFCMGMLGRERIAGDEMNPDILFGAVGAGAASVGFAAGAYLVHTGLSETLALNAYTEAMGDHLDARAPLVAHLREMDPDGDPLDRIEIQVLADDLVAAVRAREEIAKLALTDPSAAFASETINTAYAARYLGGTNLEAG